MDELERPVDVAAVAAQRMNFFVDSQTVCSTGCIYSGSATAPEARTQSDSKPPSTQVLDVADDEQGPVRSQVSALHGVWGGKETINPTHADSDDGKTARPRPAVRSSNIASLTYARELGAIADTPMAGVGLVRDRRARSEFGYRASGSGRI